MSWEQLKAILDEGRAEARNPRPVVACPRDGNVLEAGPHGQAFCRFCGWQPGDDETVTPP